MWAGDWIGIRAPTSLILYEEDCTEASGCKLRAGGVWRGFARQYHRASQQLQAERQCGFIDVEGGCVQWRNGRQIPRDAQAKHGAGAVLQVARKVFAAHTRPGD